MKNLEKKMIIRMIGRIEIVAIIIMSGQDDNQNDRKNQNSFDEKLSICFTEGQREEITF